MHTIAFALACLASGHARRVQRSAVQRWQGGLPAAFNHSGSAPHFSMSQARRAGLRAAFKERTNRLGHHIPMMYNDQGDDLSSCTVKDLKAKLKSLGKKVSGNKPELIARLEQARSEKCSETKSEFNGELGERAIEQSGAQTVEVACCTGQESLSQISTGVAIGVEHGQLLPETYTSRIPAADEQILNFLLFFLESEGLDNVPLYINGGYVRDLLRGEEEPDDLDLSICLRGSPEEVTVMGLLEKLPTFAKENPGLGIKQVKFASIMANEAKTKMLDAFKSLFCNDQGQKIEVDVMPTIGQELYEQGSRHPIRDHRGCVEEDALRRDLTVGAMLLQVERGSGRRLSYRLLDFYGGLADLRACVLRAPFPLDKTYEEVASAVLRTDAARKLAESLALSSRPHPEAVQILWWAKLLMDDPVRACRALRFVARLRGFTLHDSFWEALPFALEALRSTVAGSRKHTEFKKVASSGYEACKDFVELAFTRILGPTAQVRLASALFGGLPAAGQAEFLSDFEDFDTAAFQELSGALEGIEVGTYEPDELLGPLLAAAIGAARGLKGSPEDNFIAACSGLSGSRQMMFAGQHPLFLATKWVREESPPSSLDVAFADICGVSSKAMQMYANVWRDFRMPGSKANPAISPERRELTLRLAQHFVNQSSEPSKAHLPEGLPEALQIVAQERLPLRGNLMTTPGVLNVPPRQRTRVIALLEITVRLLGYDRNLESSEDLEIFLDHFPAIQAALSRRHWEVLETNEPKRKKRKSLRKKT